MEREEIFEAIFSGTLAEILSRSIRIITEGRIFHIVLIWNLRRSKKR